MTTHTDRKSAEILAALDKLAENGMPFIDVVKQGGFVGFPAKGVQPPPTEPVQVHEDPGAAYWKEATKMAEHTDRIRQIEAEMTSTLESEFLKALDRGHNVISGNGIEDRIRQMAQEAGYRAETASGDAVIITYEQLARFARLVAKDCARIADESEPRRGVGDDIRARYSLKD